MLNLGATRIIESLHAVSRTPVTWIVMPPLVRQPRSKRLRRKLLRRSARPDVIVEPCAYLTPFGMVMHPTMARALDRHLAERARQAGERTTLDAMLGRWA